MASSPTFITLAMFLCFFSSVAFFSTTMPAAEAKRNPPVANGLSYTFYKSSCPKLESIVRNHLKQVFTNNVDLAAGLLRLHFHDCFVQGCDGSVLLDGPASEKKAIPNLTLQRAAFKTINDLRALIDKVCGRVVSCADVVALAARDSVAMSGGPDYKVPLGRRDGLSPATNATVLADLPPPTSNVSHLLTVLNKINLDADDLVALSGGHTIGIAHCPSFTNRLYPTQDPSIANPFAKNLKLTCPAATTDNTTVNDIRSPRKFDNKYYVDLVNREGLFTSDQGLYSDKRTRPVVTGFAGSQQLFFKQFVYSIVKMGQINVLTGNNGEVRADCSARNAVAGDESLLWSVVDGLAESVGF